MAEADTKDGGAAASNATDIVVELRVPVQAHGETLKKITFREPTGTDLMIMGDKWPVNIDWQTGDVSPNPAVMGGVMALLATVPPSTIKSMKGRDYATCAHALMSFFVPDARAT